MSNWKHDYCSRYKGRGNSWIKIPYSSPASKMIKKKLKTFKEKGLDITDYEKHCNRKSFFWIRYHNVIGTKDNPFVSFQIRFEGSKIDHKNNLITIPAKISSRFDLLGNTPHRLKLELTDKEMLSMKTENVVISSKTKTKESKDVLEKEEIFDENNNKINAMSYKEGTVIPSINYSLPKKDDVPIFKEFLLYENAISGEQND